MKRRSAGVIPPHHLPPTSPPPFSKTFSHAIHTHTHTHPIKPSQPPKTQLTNPKNVHLRPPPRPPRHPLPPDRRLDQVRHLHRRLTHQHRALLSGVCAGVNTCLVCYAPLCPFSPSAPPKSPRPLSSPAQAYLLSPAAPMSLESLTSWTLADLKMFVLGT